MPVRSRTLQRTGGGRPLDLGCGVLAVQTDLSLNDLEGKLPAEDGFADGLLGRDFLDQFSVAMDPTTGTVKLVPRQQ